MKTVELRYGIVFGKGDSSDWIDWSVELTDEEDELMNLYTQLMRLVITTEEYCEDFTYGIYQIEKEIYSDRIKI